MKNRAFLPLIEQIFMIAVFAIIASVCIGCFSAARQISVKTEATDGAVILAQNTAEMLKKEKNLSEKSTVRYNKEFLPDTEGEYTVITTPLTEDDPFLGGADILVTYNGDQLFGLTVYWQEELPDEK